MKICGIDIIRLKIFEKERSGDIFRGIAYGGILIFCLSFVYIILAAILSNDIIKVLAGIVLLLTGILIFGVGLLGYSCFLWKCNLSGESVYRIEEIE